MGTAVASLQKMAELIAEKLSSYGLTFYDTIFEICPGDTLARIGAYGMPIRFSHWSFGKAFDRLRRYYAYDIHKYHELVFNTDPCYAFILEDDSPVRNMTILAHVFAHNDFFKHNIFCRMASTQMLDTMARHAERIKSLESNFGKREVETVLDAVLAVQEHVNPYAQNGGSCGQGLDPNDLLSCLASYGHYLEDWQRELILLIREEMLYFRPQMSTKIINESWANFWHTKIMREIELPGREAIESAKFNAQITMPDRIKLNPYALGLQVFMDVAGREGISKILQARAVENDISFLHNYLDAELIATLDLYLYQKIDNRWVVTETDPCAIKKELVKGLINCGFPIIIVEDINYGQKGELYLKHKFEDVELDILFLEKTLPYLYLLWGCPVHLETVINSRPMVFSHAGKRSLRKAL